MEGMGDLMATCSCCGKEALCKLDTDMHDGQFTPICPDCQDKGAAYVRRCMIQVGRAQLEAPHLRGIDT